MTVSKPSRQTHQTAPRLRALLLGALAGAVFEYLWDPNRGRHRRAVTRDQALSALRHGSRKLVRLARYGEGRTYGAVERSLHVFVPDNPFPDDLTLRDRVESELFRDWTVTKGDLNIDVARGIVELRGQADTHEDIAALEAKVRAIPGVSAIHNYLHLPGTPAPNKARVLTIASTAPTE